ncbi:hypothetical protein ACQKWADRAFT_328381 [Trichoderma austrokoningii]
MVDHSRNHPPPTTSARMPSSESWTTSVMYTPPAESQDRGSILSVNTFAAQTARASFRGSPSSSAHPYGLNGVYGGFNGMTSLNGINGPNGVNGANGVNSTHRFGTSEPPRGNLFELFAPQPRPQTQTQTQTQPPVRVLIRNLSANTTEEALRLMLIFSHELASVELLAAHNADDPRFRSAMLYFRTMSGAVEAQSNLNGRANMTNSGTMLVDVLATSTYSSPVRMTPNPVPLASPSAAAASNADPFTSAVARATQPSIGNGFPSHDATSPTMRGRFFGSVSAHQDLAAPDTEAGNHYRNLFNPQSPIGNHLANEQPGRLGKYLINNELGDDEDSELLRDSIPYAESSTAAQRRATAPNIPSSQTSALSINTSIPPSLPSYIPNLISPLPAVNGNSGYTRGGQQQNRLSFNQMPQQSQQSRSQAQQSRSQAQQLQQDTLEIQHQLDRLEIQPLPTSQQQDRQQQDRHQDRHQDRQQQERQQDRQQQDRHHDRQHQYSNHHSSHHSNHHSSQQVSFGRSTFPPVNPADQNPPCNTLYVGNLPVDTSEEELKAMFSKQRGYKRLCFRTKANGPMCFVEFEDISMATRALNEMYGAMLHNSTKGGIRLSFSKNPLGVRSGQPTSQGSQTSAAPVNGNGNGAAQSSTSNGFTAASGPPPGLSVPPGLASRSAGYTLASQRSSQQSSTPANGSNSQQQQQPQQAQDSYFAYSSSNNGNGTMVSFSNSSSSRNTPFYTNGASRTARTPFA